MCFKTVHSWLPMGQTHESAHTHDASKESTSAESTNACFGPVAAHDILNQVQVTAKACLLAMQLLLQALPRPFVVPNCRPMLHSSWKHSMHEQDGDCSF